jgi:hypothetical protein
MNKNIESMRTAFNSAIEFAISQGVEASTFLRCWTHGEWEVLAKEWPEFDLNTVGDPIASKYSKNKKDFN